MASYTLRDTTESILAIFAFAPLFFAPGFLAAWMGNIGHFRTASWPERILWSVSLSLALGTMLSVWTASIGGLNLAVACYVLVTLAAGALAFWQRDLLFARRAARASETRYFRLALAAVALWSVLCVLQLVDLQWGNKLFVSVTVRDHCYRAAFIESVLRSGIPPTNPLYFTGHAAVMRNYYFWYVVGAVICKATLLQARNVLIASCVWASIGVFSVAGLFCKYFLPSRLAVRRTAFTALLLFGVTGLDLIMVVVLHFTPIHRFDADMEWWDPDHFPSWLDSFLYVPHHVASLTCCLVVLLLLWVSRQETSTYRRVFSVVIAAVGFTAAFGLSIYVAFAFALSVGFWIVFLLLEHETRLVRSMLQAGLISAVMLIPFLLQLRSGTQATGTKQVFPLALRVRSLYGLEDLAHSLAAASPRLALHIKIVRSLLWFVLLTPDLALELGFVGLCGAVTFMQLRRGRLRNEPGTRALLTLTGGSMIATLAIRSSITTINDWGMRTAMLPLFFLLILAAALLTGGPLPSNSGSGSAFPGKTWSRVATLFLWLGAAGTVYQAMGIRTFLPLYESGRLRDHRTNAAFPQMSEHVYELRNAYAYLSRHVPASATVQYNSSSIGSYFLYVNMLNAGHQIISAEPGCGKSFGGDASACPRIEEAINALYLDPVAPKASAISICTALGIDYLVVSDQDAAWQDGASWVWTAPAVVEGKTVRILECRNN